MANTLRFKRGLVSGIPTAALGEPLFTTDTFDLYIGNGTGNTRFQKYIASGATTQILRGDGSLYTFPLAISSPSAGQVLKYNGTSWVNDSDAGITGSGTTNYLPKFTGATTLGDSNLINNASGHLGLGVTPSSWGAINGKVLELGYNGGNAAFFQNGPDDFWTTSNAYFNSGWKYIKNGTATAKLMSGGEHFWYNAISGTANGAITLNQVARITSGGNFIINNASVNNGLRFQVTGDGFFSGGLGVGTTPVLVSNYGVITIAGSSGTFYRAYTGAAETFRISTTATTTTFSALAGDLQVHTQSAFNVIYLTGTGSVGLGTSSISAGVNLALAKNITGSATSFGTYQYGTIQSDVTGSASLFHTLGRTQAAAFTLGNLRHYFATQDTLGAGSAITNQFGFSVSSSLVGATNNYGFYGDIASGTGRWNLYMNGTAANYINGSLSIGTTSTTRKFQISGTEINFSATSTSADAMCYGVINTTTAGNLIYGINRSSSNGLMTGALVNAAVYYIDTNNALQFGTNNSARVTIFGDGNVGIGTTTNATYKLDVNGTMRVSGASTFGGNIALQLNQNAQTKISISNTTSGTASQATYEAISESGRFSSFGKVSGSLTTYKIVNGGDATFYNSNSIGDIAILNDFASGSIKMAAGGSSTAHFTIASTGAATFSSSVQAGTAIAIGTTPDTNKPFKILKNINGTVGINFENTSTGSLAFSAIQMGTDVSGGTKFTNLVYSSSGVTASGVYNPDGTSLINNGSGGLNFLGTPIRFYTGGSNGVLRYLFDNEGAIQYTTTAPTTNAVDGYKQYSADVVAGNAAPHFRTENGAVIKLYQETTGVGNAIFSQGGGNSVLDDSTFDGYTLRQIVKALRNQGILA